MENKSEDKMKLKSTSMVDYLIEKYGIKEIKEKVLPPTKVTEPNHKNEQHRLFLPYFSRMYKKNQIDETDKEKNNGIYK